MAGSGYVQANNSNWQCKITLDAGWNRVRATGSWQNDPGRPPVGPGGNGAFGGPGYPSGGGQGAMLVRENGGPVIHAFADPNPLQILGPGYVEFVMNDNNYADNSGQMFVDCLPLPPAPASHG